MLCVYNHLFIRARANWSIFAVICRQKLRNGDVSGDIFLTEYFFWDELEWVPGTFLKQFTLQINLIEKKIHESRDVTCFY